MAAAAVARRAHDDEGDFATYTDFNSHDLRTKLPPFHRHVRHLSSFAELEVKMWQAGAAAYQNTFATVTDQATNALLDGAGVPRTPPAMRAHVMSIACVHRHVQPAPPPALVEHESTRGYGSKLTMCSNP